MQQATVAAPRRALSLSALPEIDAPRLCLAVFCLAFFCLSLLHPTDPDYWWHLRTGELIVDSRSVPQTDPFSFTAEGADWIAHEWLAEVVIHGVQSIGGYGANVVLFSGLALAALLIAYRVALTFGPSRWLAVLLFVWTGFMSVPYWVVRPQVFTWLFFAIFVMVCLDHKSGRNRLWVLPVLMVLWANLHGGYVFGLGLIGLYTLSLVAERLLWAGKTELKPPILALAGSIGATLLTPNPIELLLYPLSYLRPGNASMAMINEWQSPDFHSILFIPLALALVALVGIGVFGKRRDLFLPLLALVFAFFALQSVRNQPLFAIIFLIVAAWRCSERFDWARFRASGGPVHSLLNSAILLGLGVGAGILLATSSGHQVRTTASVEDGLDYPSGGAAFIRSEYPAARIFNDYGWGGYLISELYPQKVFIDGRADVYGDGLMKQHQDVRGLKRNWREVLDRHAIDLIVIRDDSALSERLDAEPEAWRRVFTGPSEAIFVRNSLTE